MKTLSDLTIRINRVLQAIERIENQHKPYTNGNKLDKLDKLRIKLFTESADAEYDICENCFNVLFNPSYQDFFFYHEYSDHDVKEIEEKANAFNKKHTSIMEIERNEFSARRCDCCASDLTGLRVVVLGFNQDKTNN